MANDTDKAMLVGIMLFLLVVNFSIVINLPYLVFGWRIVSIIGVSGMALFWALLLRFVVAPALVILSVYIIYGVVSGQID